MSTHGAGDDALPGGRALDLRRAFDRSFAEAPVEKTAQSEDLLAIRVGAHPYAIRIAEISGLFAGKTITRMPNTMPEFLGIAGFRGAVVPVYDLRVLLGYPTGDMPRWLVIVRTASVAVAFDAFEGHQRAAGTAIAAEAGGNSVRRHVREILRTADLDRPIVRMDSIIEAVKQRAYQGMPNKKE